ncbi:MAG: DUF4296 domain-containing protein [Vicingaceae bacterium]
MKQGLIYIFIIISVLFSCKTETKETAPADLIEWEKMVDVITEVELTQAVVKVSFSTQDSINAKKLYADVFESFNITEKQFNSSLNFYCKDPIETEKLYADAIEKLSEKQAAKNED